MIFFPDFGIKLQNQFEESTAPDASAESESPFAGPEADKLLENKVTNACDWNALAEIEQRLKQKMFSRQVNIVQYYFHSFCTKKFFSCHGSYNVSLSSWVMFLNLHIQVATDDKSLLFYIC